MPRTRSTGRRSCGPAPPVKPNTARKTAALFHPTGKPKPYKTKDNGKKIVVKTDTKLVKKLVIKKLVKGDLKVRVKRGGELPTPTIRKNDKKFKKNNHK